MTYILTQTKKMRLNLDKNNNKHIIILLNDSTLLKILKLNEYFY